MDSRNIPEQKRKEWIDNCVDCFKRKTVFRDSGKCWGCENP